MLGSASSNSNRAALSVYAWTVHTWAALLDRTGCRKPDGVGYTRIDCEWGVNGSGPEGAAGNVPSWAILTKLGTNMVNIAIFAASMAS